MVLNYFLAGRIGNAVFHRNIFMKKLIKMYLIIFNKNVCSKIKVIYIYIFGLKRAAVDTNNGYPWIAFSTNAIEKLLETAYTKSDSGNIMLVVCY